LSPEAIGAFVRSGFALLAVMAGMPMEELPDIHH